MKRKRKTEVAKLKDKLWDLCKAIIRKQYEREDGTWTCYTCENHISTPGNAHTSHFIPDAACGAYLRYDLRNLRVTCFHCNINLGGNGSSFYKHLVENEGQEYVDQLFKDKHVTVKADKWWYMEMIESYKIILEELK